MKVRHTGIAAAVALCCALSGRVLAGCVLGRIAELPVTMNGTQPTITAGINGRPATFLIDSGAFYSLMSPANAAELHLRLDSAPFDLHVNGVGGQQQAMITTVRDFNLTHVDLRNVQFVVAGGQVGPGLAGVIGQNILRLADTEYDFADGVVRLWHPHGCGHSVLAYWVKTQPYSVIDIEWTSPGKPQIIGTATLNGTPLNVLFDTGSAESLLSLEAAESAGFKRDGPGVERAGFLHGIGPEPLQAWVGTFRNFTIGGETIRNARLRVADMKLGAADMLLGADFFLANRIYVAVSQRKLYFTYNGGPIFSPTAPQAHTAASPPQRTAPAPGPQAARAAAEASAAGHGTAQGAPALPADAATLSRLGAALAARHEFAQAIADFTEACDLAPANPLYLYERALARLGNRQPSLALTDFDRTLALEPNDVPALVERAHLLILRHDDAHAIGDLDSADRLAAKQADIRLALADLYLESRRYAPAVRQFDLWIDNHAEDSRKASAFNGRCSARGLWGQDLKQALSDCNLAIWLRPGTADFLASRALVEVRLGRYRRAIEDESAALRDQPKTAWFLYTRGIAELRDGKTADGRADISAAEALQPNIEALGRARGLTRGALTPSSSSSQSGPR
ncbi:MAG: aspartyl protease family protein [Steroidobacteraceae bacterium]